MSTSAQLRPVHELAIEVRDVRRDHGKAERMVHALAGVSLTVAVGETVAIVGPSGSGKSTLLRLLGGLDTPTAGEVKLFGESTAGWGVNRWAESRANDLGFVFQASNLFEVFTALENVIVPLELAGMARHQAEDRGRELLGHVGLGDKLDRLPGQLSGGEAQRVAIARAMTGSRQLLLADEPTAALDDETAAGVVDLLIGAAPSVVLVTHDEQIARRADRVVRLHAGAVVAT